MRYRWLQQHSAMWVEEGIITAEQRENILQLYKKRISAIQIFTILGAILIGFAALSFVAANWQGMDLWWKVILIYVVMSLSYHMGYEMDRRGLKAWSLSFGLLGTLLFGVGLLLFEQLFHPPFLSENALYLWSIGIFLVGYVYKMQWFPIFGLIVLNIAQVSGGWDGSSDWYYLLVFILLFLPYLYRYGTGLLQLVALLSFSVNVWYLILSAQVGSLWMLIYAMILLLVSLWQERIVIHRFFRYIGLLIAFLFTFAFGIDTGLPETAAGSIPLVGIGGLLAIGYLLLLRHQGKTIRFLDLVLFTPLFLGCVVEVEWFYILMLYIASFYFITVGIRQHDEAEYYTGFILFLVATLQGYSLFTWKMMNKSLFFLIGGLLLFAISYLMQKKKDDWMRKGGDEE
ncbi:DUF2157 domain-containing protein [Rubeoparvulum massiliense]|uniref:DUF2157 domain-containing protein n=1 Tax=Rubeoparvulum massiliense TaxID=1631346 RepID=UPI0011CA982D|nr:DUF2157 domain-containing protein [Rubeoparvulum massiliense]